ncbi:MAG: DUF6261 family protein [Fibrobacter sp.]|nr:DUF6261 family protein [Fibrobacter sp.]
MTQITAIKFTNFRNGEFRALHTEGVDFAKAITDKDVKQVVAAYEKSVQDLSEFMEASILETTASLVKKLDADRNEIYKSCRRVAQASMNFPDAEAAATGAQIWKVFSENPSPINMNQAQSTDVLLNIVNGLKNIGDEKLTACGFKVWLDKLEEVNNQFIATDETRISERAQKELEQGKKLRAACYDAYYAVVNAASYKAFEGSESCKAFLEAMTTAIHEKCQQVKARAVRKYNKKKAAENAANEAANEAAPTTDSVSTVGVENAA